MSGQKREGSFLSFFNKKIKNEHSVETPVQPTAVRRYGSLSNVAMNTVENVQRMPQQLGNANAVRQEQQVPAHQEPVVNQPVVRMMAPGA